MGEANKQVRVDNWGIFFLQRLQLFFNRTDYCDLTLQFEGNVQLKVHRLVMNACTEYFNILEQTCEVVDGNTIIMPDDLQADVILPIVNFMYTGMLEFQMSIFDKLYRTADIMNIPILLKLLDAQKKPIPPLPKSQTKKAQPTYNLHGKKITPKVENDLPATLPGRKLPVWKRKSVPTPPVVTTTHYFSENKKAPQDPLAIFDNTPKPTRFEWPEDEISSTFNLMENSFDDISYTSKPLLTQDDELRASTSFEEVKFTPPNSTKKSKDFNQSIDIEEVKSYVKEQKIRSDLVEYDDEDDPDFHLDNVNIDNKDIKRKASKPLSPVQTKRVRFSVSEKENKEAKINVTSTGKPTDMDHTKIISEVLKKYPHLVKKNKNIRLKILAKSPTKIETPKTQIVKTSTAKVKVQVTNSKESPKTKVSTGDVTKGPDEGPWVCTKCHDEPVEFVLYYLYRKHMTDVHNEKFDSRMCKFCGHQSNKHNMLMYHQYTRHGIRPPPAYSFPKCNRCPYIALTENLLIKHKLNHTKFDLQCAECKVAFNNQASLSSHMQITNHTGKTGRHNYDCQYCTKRYHSGSNLFSHIKMVHREEARRDGIVSIDEKDEVEDEQLEEETEEYIVPLQDEDHTEKIKILSDIKVPASNAAVSASQTTHKTTTATTGQRVVPSASTIDPGSIATSLGLVDIVVLDENQQYILHNDQQLVTQQTLESEQREYIIPEMTEQHTFAQAQNINDVMTSLHNSDIASTDELVMVLTDHDYNDGNSEILSNENSNIVVLYSHPVDGQQNQFITSQGNLMLNSQTGMLEIRNNDTHAIDNNQDSQIESIEMIQREINSHNIITSDPDSNQKTEYVTAVSTASSFDGSLNQNTVILENNFSNEELIQNKQTEDDNHTGETETQEMDVGRMIKLGTEDMEEEMAEEVLVINDCLNSQQDESMEIDEECGVQENQNVNQDVVQHEVTLQNETQPKSPCEKPEEEEGGISKSMPEIEVEAQAQQFEYQPDSSDVHVTETPEQEVVEETHEEITTYAEDTTEQTTVQESAHEVSISENCINQEEVLESQEVVMSEETIHEEAEPEIQTQEVETVASEVEEQHVVDEVREEEDQKYTENEALPAEENIVAHETTVGIDVQESPQEIPMETEDINEISESHEVQTSKENIHVESEKCTAVEEEGNIHSEHEEEQIIETGENESVEIGNEVCSEIVEVNDQNKDHSHEAAEDKLEIEEEHAQIEHEPVQIEEDHSQIEEDNSQIEEDSSQIEEEHVQIEEDAVQMQEETLQMQEETTQVHEETAQIEEPLEQIEVLTPPQMEETCSPMEEVNSQTEDATSHIDESSIQNESIDESFKDGQEETSQTSDKMQLDEQDAVSSADENSQSQDSQTSQCSSRQEELLNEYKKTTSQATKISILNDWDDTEDSQQSDNVTKKAEMTVNKLIDDWDDDDEEGHDSES